MDYKEYKHITVSRLNNQCETCISAWRKNWLDPDSRCDCHCYLFRFEPNKCVVGYSNVEIKERQVRDGYH